MREQNIIKTVINGQEVTVEQDSQTGQFFTRQDIGNIPVDYATISDRVTIGQCVKYWRLRHGYSQAELAERNSHVGNRTPQTAKAIPVAVGRTPRL